MLKEEKLKQQTEDAEEMIRLIKQLTDEERREVRGIMIGLQIAKDLCKVPA